MNIYIVCNEPFPNGMAATRRITCYAKSLAMQGDSVEVIIYHRTEIYGIPPKNTEGKGNLGLFSYRYIGGTPLRGSNVAIRRWNDFMDKRRTVAYLREHLNQGDAILLYCSDESYLTSRIANLANELGCAVVRDLCEYPFGTREDTPKSDKKRTKYLNKTFPILDGAVCISEALYDLAQAYHPKGHHIKVPILVESSEDTSIHSHPRPYIFHGGTMYERKDAIVSTMRAFADACVKLDHKIDFILAGPSSPHRDELDAIVREAGISQNVTILPQLSQKEIGSYQRGAFLTILNKHDNPQNRHGFSTKLGEVLMSETAVITTSVGEANHWLKDGESAYIVEPHRPELISAKIVEAYLNDEERKSIARHGKEIAAKYFGLEYQGKRLHDYLMNLGKKKSGR